MQIIRKYGTLFGLARKVYHLSRGFRRTELESGDPVVAYRLDALRRFERARKDGLDSSQACAAVGVARSTLYRWRRAHCGNAANLVSRSCRPHKVRTPDKRTPELALRVEALRDEHAWGKNKIAAVLRRDGLDVSPSTVGRVLRQLLADRRVEPIRAGKQPRRKTRKTARPWAVRQQPDRPAAPGDLIQVDTMFVNTGHGNRIAVLNAVDVVSRQAWSLAASNASANAAHRLLSRIRDDLQPRRLQVDGGSEFRGHFEQQCAQLQIPLHVLPPRSPKLNAHVESFNGTLRRELFNHLIELPAHVTPFNQLLQQFLHAYHHLRPHAALGFQTPAQRYNLPHRPRDPFESHTT